MADLAVMNIEYSRLPAPKSELGVEAHPPLFEFALMVRNIGNEGFRHSFEVLHTRSNEEFSKEIFHGKIIDFKDRTISPGDSAIIRFQAFIVHGTERVLIALNAREINSDNSKYILNLSW